MPWSVRPYRRAPWIRVKYGKTVKPQAQQSSNLHLSDEQVLFSRTQEIGHSFASPLSVGGDRTVDGDTSKLVKQDLTHDL